MATRSPPSPRPVPRSEPKRSASKAESSAYFRALGKRITLLRKARDYTQADLARMLGFSQQTVFAYELGDRRVSVFTLKKLAQVFEIPIEQLLGNEPLTSALQQPSAQCMYYARRLQGLSTSARLFVVKIIAVLEQRQKDNAEENTRSS